MPSREILRELTAPAPAAAPSRVRRELDPLATPVRATLWWSVLYGSALVVGRNWLVPQSQIAAAWPSVGVGFAWALYYLVLEDRWRRRATWAVLGAVGVSTTVVNVLTGMDATLAMAGGACNVVAIVVSAEAYFRWRGDRRREILGNADLLLLTLACAAGTAVAFFTLPLAGLMWGDYSWESGAFWFLRNLCGHLSLAVAALLLLGEPRRPLLPGLGWPVVGAASAVTVALLIGEGQVVPGAVIALVGLLGALALTTRLTVQEALVFQLVCASAVTALSVVGQGPLHAEPPEPRMAGVHTVALVSLVVAMTVAFDREGRAALLALLRRDAEHAERQAALVAQQADLLGTVLASMHDGVIVFDAAGRVVARNAAAARLTGCTDGEELSPPGATVGRPGHAAPPEGGDESALPATVTRALAALDGGLGRVLDVQARPIRSDGRGRVVAIVRDVTDERRQVDALRTFARVLAHDLRQPLTAVQLWQDQLRLDLEEVDPALGGEALDQMDAATTRMAGFISDLLAYTVARDGAIYPARVDLGRLIDTIVTEPVALVPGPGATVRVQAPYDVVGDEALLRQVFDNLLGNALKYTSPGSPAEVEVTQERRGGWTVTVVDDAGIGLPHGEAEHVFEEFYRVSDHAATYEGTGLGLAISKRIVERHGGRIRAGASPLGGARFEVWLPS